MLFGARGYVGICREFVWLFLADGGWVSCGKVARAAGLSVAVRVCKYKKEVMGRGFRVDVNDIIKKCCR